MLEGVSYRILRVSDLLRWKPMLARVASSVMFG